jgi:polysaccharide pyruvyl transferase WcaK-like protein
MSSSFSRVSLLGASLDVGNRGVLALGEAIADLIRASEPTAALTYHYYGVAGGARRLRGNDNCAISVHNCRLFPKRPLSSNICIILFAATLWRLGLRSPARRIPWLATLLRASFIADIRGGDSFSDIYGLRTFILGSLPLLSVILLGRPYVLLPQTYGPFRSPVARWLAARMMRQATAIWTRDRGSIPIVEALSGRSPRFAPDVAFTLPATRPTTLASAPPESVLDHTTLLVGLNVSGLLYMGGYTRDNMFGLKSSYRQTIAAVVAAIMIETRATILIIPHTFGAEMEDEASDAVYTSTAHNYPGRAFRLTTPLHAAELKWLIGRTGFFVGSRMHACIAALSQCVPTVGLAYSDKFLGVFESVGVSDAVIDLRTSSTDETVRLVLDRLATRRETAARLAGHISDVQNEVRQAFATMTAAN